MCVSARLQQTIVLREQTICNNSGMPSHSSGPRSTSFTQRAHRLCAGYIDLPGTGTKPQVWTFALKSDDGSMLYIDDELIIDYGGAAHCPLSRGLSYTELPGSLGQPSELMRSCAHHARVMQRIPAPLHRQTNMGALIGTGTRCPAEQLLAGADASARMLCGRRLPRTGRLASGHPVLDAWSSRHQGASSCAADGQLAVP